MGSEKSMVIEENEIPLYNVLTEHGFDCITVPMRHMYEFGGAIHCSTWDIKRRDSCKDYFPEQQFDRSALFKSTKIDDIKVLDVSNDSKGFVLNPSNEFQIGTQANVLKRRKVAE